MFNQSLRVFSRVIGTNAARCSHPSCVARRRDFRSTSLKRAHESPLFGPRSPLFDRRSAYDSLIQKIIGSLAISKEVQTAIQDLQIIIQRKTGINPERLIAAGPEGLEKLMASVSDVKLAEDVEFKEAMKKFHDAVGMTGDQEMLLELLKSMSAAQSVPSPPKSKE